MNDPRVQQDPDAAADEKTAAGNITINDEFHGIPEVEALLQEPLATDNTGELTKQLARGEAWLGRVSFQYRNAEAMLKQMRKQYLIPKSRDYTDLDRQISLENSCRVVECQVDLLKDQAEILRNRISLGQSLLSNHREELKRQIR